VWLGLDRVLGAGWSLEGSAGAGVSQISLPASGVFCQDTGAVCERCLAAAECYTGTCCHGVCSTCCADDAGPACGAGDTCRERAPDPPLGPLRAAWACAPDSGRGAPGAPCLADADCAGGRCAGSGGTLTVCAADGRRCGSDADCPGGAPHNSCIGLDVAGGRCQ
jgi:hypothetical protein